MVHAAIVARRTDRRTVGRRRHRRRSHVHPRDDPDELVAVGVQALVSRKAGADQKGEIGPIITTGTLLGWLTAAVLSCVAAFGAPVVFPLLDRTAEISTAPSRT